MSWLVGAVVACFVAAPVGYVIGWWATKIRVEDAEAAAKLLRAQKTELLKDNAILAAENALLRKKAGEKR
ncbi:hypothetical protein [Cohnella sp. GbtcB17]|uniref:hypothetical protein n=1 Tax=Cohnella sp. GbtcB17 TaxID=2824762 RepID=UPI001C2FB366|nr:hypothetical protein [Cohnella sp. GbtcB17]